jgi:hypothetical protein
MLPVTRYCRSQTAAFKYDGRGAPSVLGAQARTWRNKCELRRMRCYYPLWFEHNVHSSKPSSAGNLAGKKLTRLSKSLNLRNNSHEFESSPGHQIQILRKHS